MARFKPLLHLPHKLALRGTKSSSRKLLALAHILLGVNLFLIIFNVFPYMGMVAAGAILILVHNSGSYESQESLIFTAKRMGLHVLLYLMPSAIASLSQTATAHLWVLVFLILLPLAIFDAINMKHGKLGFRPWACFTYKGQPYKK